MTMCFASTHSSLTRLILVCGISLFLSACGSSDDVEDADYMPSNSAISDFVIDPVAGQDQVLNYEAFSTGYSYVHKGGLWSMYLLYANQVAVTLEREDSFKVDERVPEAYQSQLSDYSGSGYDRGHLAPNASLDHTESSQADTFYLTNIVPQTQSFNRYQWSEVEQWVRDCSLEKPNSAPLLVITGSAYGSNPDSIGEGVAIPEQNYKVIVHLDQDHYLRAFALLAPQDSFYWDNLDEHILSIDQLENQVDVDFFNSLPDSLEANLESSVRLACDLPTSVTVSPAIYYNPEAPDTSANGSDSIDFSCNSKMTCSAMNSCEEASFYLNSCGISRLDSDGDGVPCESLCR